MALGQNISDPAWSKKRLRLTLGLICIWLVSCGRIAPTPQPVSTPDFRAVETKVAATVFVQLTATAQTQPISTVMVQPIPTVSVPTATGVRGGMVSATNTKSPVATPVRTATRLPSSTSPPKLACPSWFFFPDPGMGLLVIENNIGQDLLIDALRPLNWTKTIVAKKDDVPGRLVLQLAPGHYEFLDSTYRGKGKIAVDLASIC